MKLPNPKLTKRMKCFIDHALIDKPLWDICCDHGYVGIKALETSYIRKTVFHNGILAFKNQKRIIKVGDSPSLS